MLETLKSEIENLPSISFERYFNEYVMRIQDTNIDNEISFLLRNNFLTCADIDRLTSRELRSANND